MIVHFLYVRGLVWGFERSGHRDIEGLRDMAGVSRKDDWPYIVPHQVCEGRRVQACRVPIDN